MSMIDERFTFVFPKLEYDSVFINSFVKELDSYSKSLSTSISDNERIKKDSLLYSGISLKKKVLLSLFYFDLRPFSSYQPHQVSPYKTKTLNLNAQNKVISEDFSKPPSKAYLSKPLYLVSYKNMNSYASERNGSYTSPNHILLGYGLSIVYPE